MEMTRPKINVAIGLTVSLIQGGIMPVFGVLLGFILFRLEVYTISIGGISC